MATLVSVNVGLPKDVSWNGRVVHTGAWKEPVTGPRLVRRLNVDGDGQGDLGGHGGENRAVLIYQLDSYRHWAREFNRDDLRPGYLGENLTVEGLADDEVCIGDRYRIGQAVFEVTQPRVTCYRAGMRIGEPAMAALLVAHRRPGFYCRVLTEGVVEAGDEIERISTGPEQVTVAEIDALLYLPGHPRDDLVRALRIPALSPGWKQSLQNLVHQDQATSGNSGLAASGPPPAWPGFRALEVTSVHDETPHVRSVCLADPSGSPLPAWLPGQSITLRLGADKSLVRNYSLSNRPGSDHYRISVKREARGTASTFIHEHVEVGDRIDVAAARGTFFLDETDTPILLLSAGIGATPVLSMLHSLASSQSTREIWWLHGARDGTELPFDGEVRDLLTRLPHSRFRIFFSRPRPDDLDSSAGCERGHLSAEVISRLDIPTDGDAYVCGPVSFMDQLSAALSDRGLPSSRVHTERFGAAAALTPGIASAVTTPHPPAGPPGSGPQVQFARSGVAAPWGPPSASLLEFAETCDVPTRWSCRTGVCHNCETALLSGSVRYDPEPLEPPAGGNILICCSQPAEPVVLDL